MATISYMAKRSLIDLHAAGESCILEIDVTEAQRSTSVKKAVKRSIGGAMETLRHSADVEWLITFEPVAGVDLALLREFLDSTDSGETFSIDIYGSSSSVRSMRRTDDGHAETPFMRLGSESSDYFTASITAIET
jgi:hypothetical protein